MLDSRLPSRMLSAFPPGVPVRRCGLAEAIAETVTFSPPTKVRRGLNANFLLFAATMRIIRQSSIWGLFPE